MAYRTTPSANLTHKAKTPPPEETMQEAAYLKWLGEKQKPVSIKLRDGEIVRGWVEYYDRNMVRLTRENAPNLFIFKAEILYISEGGKETVRRNARAKSTVAEPPTE
ncbi:MAG: Sm ribonucleo-like protein [Acidobacteriaceae bacterium]